MTTPALTNEAGREIGQRIQVCVTLLLEASVHFLQGRTQRGLAELKHVNVDVSALRVFVEQQIGPVKLPPAKLKRKREYTR
jgi:hypothetical protein